MNKETHPRNQPCPEPLNLLLRLHPVKYFFVVFGLALAAGAVLFDVIEFLDVRAWPMTVWPKYYAAFFVAVGAHVGLAWKRRSGRKG